MKSPRGALILLVTAYLLLAILYSLTTPAWEAPDEDGHFQYVLHLRQTGQLPVQGQNAIGSAHHAPLYYAMASLLTLPIPAQAITTTFAQNPHFMWHGNGSDVNYVIHTADERFPFSNAAWLLHLARLASVLMGAGVVALVVVAGWTVFPQQPTVGLLAGVLTAFNPQFLFISGSINNDNLLALMGATTLLLVLRYLRRPGDWVSWLWIGLAVAAAILSKVSGLMLLGWAGIVLTAEAAYRRSPRAFFTHALALVAPVVIGTSWWVARNVTLYGDPLGWQRYRAIFTNTLRTTPIPWPELAIFPSVQLRSFWASFGWVNVFPPQWFYSGIILLCGMALVGLVIYLVRWRESRHGTLGASLAALVLLCLLYQGYLLYSLNVFDASWYQGRYLFPVIGALTILAAVGLHALTGFRRMGAVTAALALLLGAAALYMPFFVIAPSYR